MLLLSAAASVNSAIGGLGPFDTPFESPGIAHDNQLLAANAPAPEPLPGPLRQLLLRGPGTGRPAGQPAGCPSDRSTYRMMPPCPAAGTIFRHVQPAVPRAMCRTATACRGGHRAWGRQAPP